MSVDSEDSIVGKLGAVDHVAARWQNVHMSILHKTLQVVYVKGGLPADWCSKSSPWAIGSNLLSYWAPWWAHGFPCTSHASLLAASIEGRDHRSPFVRYVCAALLIGLLKNG